MDAGRTGTLTSKDDRRGHCFDCNAEWVERAPKEIEVCPQCGSRDVEEIDL